MHRNCNTSVAHLYQMRYTKKSTFSIFFKIDFNAVTTEMQCLNQFKFFFHIDIEFAKMYYNALKKVLLFALTLEMYFRFGK